MSDILGGYSVGVPPLPIPNREVKPNCADGSAYSVRVGSRRFSKSLVSSDTRLFFFVYFNPPFGTFL